jgi:hypothetical protein
MHESMDLYCMHLEIPEVDGMLVAGVMVDGMMVAGRSGPRLMRCRLVLPLQLHPIYLGTILRLGMHT